MEWEKLDQLIADFEARLAPKPEPEASLGLGAAFWRETWEAAARIQEGFREARYPTKEEKDAAWARFAAIRKVASRRQQEEWKERTGVSRKHRDEIFAKIEAARPTGISASDRHAADQLKSLAEALKEAGEQLSQAKDEMLAEQKQECFKALQEVRRAHDALWSEVRQARLKQRSEQAERAQANLAKNHERLEKATQALTYFQARSEELRTKIAEAWNEEWKTRAAERLTEIDAKILDIEASITRIEEWIKEDEGKAKKTKPEHTANVGQSEETKSEEEHK